MAPSGQNKPTSESAFRANMSGFKWARGVCWKILRLRITIILTDESSNLQPPSTSTSNDTNPFTRFTNSFSGYVPLRSNERSNEEEASVSNQNKMIGRAMICFIISFFTLPLLAIKPRKFAVSFSLGSILFMIGFMVLQGPIQHLKHIFSTDRLPFTISYLIRTLISGLIQVVVLVVYFVAYFPGGLTTLRFMGNIGMRGASSYLPV
ncbi:hypothetical protein PSTT_13093 [Puccinia striiformis]|uniref:Protein transport protein SFT2 n=1 Tax=Puccinia striiformis TaxID=27350 RepID=A0A2S4UTE1_9BASI|nr:hypothetical protein PSTT_13093 [Puccinia striiformis]